MGLTQPRTEYVPWLFAWRIKKLKRVGVEVNHFAICLYFVRRERTLFSVLHLKFIIKQDIEVAGKSYEAVKQFTYEGWNFNSGKYLFTTDTK